MELVPTVSAYLLLLVVGTLLLVIGVGLRFLSSGPELKRWGITISGYGLFALALWAFLWFVGAWESGVIESIGK
jgi:hypothetical protein